MKRLRIVLPLVFLSIAGSLGSPQIPRDLTGTEIIAGTVTRDDTKTALPLTRVELVSADYVRLPTGHEKVCKPEPDSQQTEERRFAMTDRNGKFTFSNVAPGRYYLMAEHEGYLRGQLNSKSSSPYGPVIEVGPPRDRAFMASERDSPMISQSDLFNLPPAPAEPPTTAGAPSAIQRRTLAQTGQRGGLGREGVNLPEGAGAPSAISDGPPGATPRLQLRSLAIGMIPALTIVGSVADERGAPLAAAAVQAYEFRYTPMNGRTLTSVRTALTAEDGKYRLFYLDPGRYVVAAANSIYQRMHWMSSLTFTPNLPSPDPGLPAVFFAATTSAANALPVVLQREIQPVADFRLQDRPRSTVRVKLIGNSVPANPRLIFVPYGGDLCAGLDFGISAESDATFELRDVPEGLYVAVAMSGRDFISDVVTVRVEPRTGPGGEIRIPVTPSTEVRGNIVFEAIAPGTHLGSLRVSLVRAGQEISQVSTTLVDPDTGRFSIPGVGPGSYYPVVDMPPGAYIQNITASKFDAAKPEDCDSSASQASPHYAYQDLHGHFDPQQPFRIPTVIPDAAQCLVIRISFGNFLAGYVRDPLGKPVSGALIVALPRSVWGKAPDQGATPPDRYLTTTTDHTGYFRLLGVAPYAFAISGQSGQVETEYHLYAFEDINPNRIYDPDFSDRVFGGESFEFREFRYEGIGWTVKKIATSTIATWNTCGLDTNVIRTLCYLTSIPTADIPELQ